MINLGAWAAVQGYFLFWIYHYFIEEDGWDGYTYTRTRESPLFESQETFICSLVFIA